MLAAWDSNDISIFMDISTYCNAGCPQCHRTDNNGLGKVDWLPLVQWTIDQFKTAFSAKTMSHIKRFHFCGTWGDPIMVKDILKIVKYIIQYSNARVSFDTNGSMRSEEFWWDLGVSGGDRLTLRFDVDGINQEMHQHYRRFTDLSKVLNHMSIASQTNCNVAAQTILFKHNEDYKNEIKSLCEKHGSKAHVFVTSDRFKPGQNTTQHTDENGNAFILEKAGTKVIAADNIIPVKSIKEQPKNIVIPVKPAPVKEQPKVSAAVTQPKHDIECAWAKPRNEIIVSYDGQVLPCCYHQNNYHTNRNYFIDRDPLYTEYEDNKLKYNVLHEPLKDIIDSKWWSGTLVDSIANNPIRTCIVNCAKKTGNAKNQKREHMK